MEQTCSECLSLDVKYNCGWCRSKDIRECRVADHCPSGTTFLKSNEDSCPDIEIISVCCNVDTFIFGYNSYQAPFLAHFIAVNVDPVIVTL